jgi:hypothetical protein
MANSMPPTILKTAPTSGSTGFYFFLLDMTVVNMFIIYLVECKRRSKKPINHLQFRVGLCEVLLHQWGPGENQGPPRSINYCYLASKRCRSLVRFAMAMEWPRSYKQGLIARGAITST